MFSSEKVGAQEKDGKSKMGKIKFWKKLENLGFGKNWKTLNLEKIGKSWKIKNRKIFVLENFGKIIKWEFFFKTKSKFNTIC